MATIVCEECFEIYGSATDYLDHKGKEHGERYGIRAIFTCEGKEDRYTYFDEQIFNSEEEALEAINDSYGEELAQASTLDSRIEQDLIGYLYEDLEPYLIEEEEK
jgi:hypothetical protein